MKYLMYRRFKLSLVYDHIKQNKPWIFVQKHFRNILYALGIFVNRFPVDGKTNLRLSQ